MFALIAEDELYFRIDELIKEDYESYESKPFVYTGMKKPVALPYMTLPEEILENPQELPHWIEKAYKTALKHKKPKKK